MTFEEDMRRLEEINARLKDPGTTLEKAVELYEEGSELRKGLEKKLEDISRRIELVTSKEGEPMQTAPMPPRQGNTSYSSPF